MKWQSIGKLAEENLLEVSRPHYGYLPLMIVDRRDDAAIAILFWATQAHLKFLRSLAAYKRSTQLHFCRNKAAIAALEITAILRQRDQ
jgi:hypothetical protein